MPRQSRRASVAQLLQMMPDQLYPFAWGAWGANSQAYGYQPPGSLPMDTRPALCPQPAPACYLLPCPPSTPPVPPTQESPPQPPEQPPWHDPPPNGAPLNGEPEAAHAMPSIDTLFTPSVSGTSDQPFSGYPSIATQLPVPAVQLDSGNLATSGAMGAGPPKWKPEDFAVPAAAVSASRTAVAALLVQNPQLAKKEATDAVFAAFDRRMNEQASASASSQHLVAPKKIAETATPAPISAPWSPPPTTPREHGEVAPLAPVAAPSQVERYASIVEECRRWGYERGRDDRKKGRPFDRDAVSHYGTAGIGGAALQPCVSAIVTAYAEGWSSIGPKTKGIEQSAEVHPFYRPDDALTRMMNHLPARGRRY